jgi:hypothetical protein
MTTETRPEVAPMTDFLELDHLRKKIQEQTDNTRSIAADLSKANAENFNLRIILQALQRKDGHFSPECMPGMCVWACAQARKVLGLK